MHVEHGRAELYFSAVDEKRVYATETASLRRVTLQIGDPLVDADGKNYVVTGLDEENGLVVYVCDEKRIPEKELSATMDFSGAKQRLLSGRVDSLYHYHLRTQSQRFWNSIQTCAVRGLLGGKVDLIPHQLSIVQKAIQQVFPRVLLADEVGLGKTIEACQIMQHLAVTGRAKRILIIVPEPLTHQWFVELLRRFHMLFALFDEERCASIEASGQTDNPFYDSQYVLCSIDFLIASQERATQIVEAGWDCLIVDEAHHLEWRQDFVSPEYALIEQLCAVSPCVLLLTATPQQLGVEGHFARLRLLDKQRYNVLSDFIHESDHYEKIADLLNRYEQVKTLDEKDRVFLTELSPRLLKYAEKDHDIFIDDLIDVFATGRTMFRNKRINLNGFPKRVCRPYLLSASTNQFLTKIEWLVRFLNEDLDRKVLLICRTKETVKRIAEALKARLNVDLAEFHEELTLLQRDRNAAYFAEEEGARLLICSEIGSEGRNFQFCHHLVLFDLPEHPDLLEQRIGRLDRIGQVEEISIHVPVIVDTPEHRLMRWYHEGLNAFEQTLPASSIMWDALKSELYNMLDLDDSGALELFLEKTMQMRQKASEKMAKGYDRLLARTSFDKQLADETVQQMEVHDRDQAFEKWVISLLEFCGMSIEKLEERSYVLKPAHLISDAFPEIPEEGLTVTFDRKRALSREHWAFLSMDHPIVLSAIEFLLTSETGNTSYAVWKSGLSKKIYLEVQICFQCLAAAHLNVQRFFAPKVMRFVVDHELADASEDATLAMAKLENLEASKLLQNTAVMSQLLPKMLDQLNLHSAGVLKSEVEKALAKQSSFNVHEEERLRDFLQKNNHSEEAEMGAFKDRMKSVESAIRSASYRIDALRVIVRLP